MKLKVETTEYIDWDDLEKFFCEVLEIKQEFFRDYHFVHYNIDHDEYWKNHDRYIYMDLWHVWLWYIDDRIISGCMTPLYIGDEESDEGNDYFESTITKRFGIWAIEPLQKMISALKTELNREQIFILYDW